MRVRLGWPRSLIKPRLFSDERGYFVELHRDTRYREAGIDVAFVQDNLSTSGQGVLRGLHYQSPHGQAKLVTVVSGEIYDVVVDIRRGSPTFGKWHGQTMTVDDHLQLFVPIGFAHGFCVVSGEAQVLYKCSELYDPASEHTILATDPDLGIAWPVRDPIVSQKDAAGRRLKDAVIPN